MDATTLDRDTGYASYLLRLRRVQTGCQYAWVATLQSTATGEQRCFSSADALARFIQTEFGGRSISPDANEEVNERQFPGD